MSEVKVFTTRELCDKLRVSRETLWRWQKSGKLPCIKEGQRVFVRKDVADKFGL